MEGSLGFKTQVGAPVCIQFITQRAPPYGIQAGKPKQSMCLIQFISW
jgi:hypothetical protein